MAKKIFYSLLIPTVALLLLAGRAAAVLEIQITEGVEGEVPVAIVPFEWAGPGEAPEQVADIVSSDLTRTGRFSLTPEQDFLERPHHGGEVNFQNWQALGVENLVVGRVQPADGSGYRVQFQLFDIYKKGPGRTVVEPDYKVKQLLGYNLPTPQGKLRRTAHRISDLIYEKLTGERGAFSTRIAYVTASGAGDERSYTLQVADADGHNAFEILRSRQPIMSPAWSPDGKRLAYVSFENQRSEIFVQNLSTNERRSVSSRRGINGAPSWSPDGSKLALTLSHADAGNPEIYVLDVASSDLRRVTYNSAIDTEPDWSPDGRTLVFTSDRSGAAQLYRVPSEGGRAQRLTFEGNYNAAPVFSPDGNRLAMVHGSDGKFRIAVMELDSGILRIVTDGNLDESPTFAPNGGMILYAAGDRAQGELAAVSVDGRVRQRLTLQQGDVREPAWGPFSD